MIKDNNEVQIDFIVNKEPIKLKIFGENSSVKTIFKIDNAEAIINGEASFQLIEGHFYEYFISGNYRLKASEIINPSRINSSSGRIVPNIYVGTLTIDILDPRDKKCAEVKIEIRSKKISYRSDYRLMLEEITEKCIDLLLQQNSPTAQNFTPNFESDSKTLYQRFSFIKSVLTSEEFNDSIHKIIAIPVTRWEDTEKVTDVTRLRKVGNKEIRQMTGSGNRIILPDNHSLRRNFSSLPSKINVIAIQESTDTPENRFIKHALITFAAFIGDFREKSKIGTRLNEEASQLENYLDNLLNNSLFKKIGSPTIIPLNSPTLQRKEGYKEVLKAWLMFDLAAKLIWQGGDEVYEAGKRDVAVLYEYWLFFQLLDLIKDTFQIEPKSIEQLIKPTKDGLGLQLKQGKHIAINGIHENSSRKLNVEFSFNRPFSGKKNYPNAGSWTKGMRPDFTLSIWPFGIDQQQAEIEELIIHIHFDAKYKVEGISTIFDNEIQDEDLEETLNTEEKENDKGNFKRIDLLKMHSYKDAIRRTAGAYILYPGNSEKSYQRQGFHEVIPGLGAFAIKPSKLNNGIGELKVFLNDVVQHFLNRASQREKIAFKNFDVYNSNNKDELREPLPETFGKNRSLIPDDTSVLIGFYKNEEHLNWILKNKLYNFRTGTDSGSLSLGIQEINARFLVLHGPGKIVTRLIYNLKNGGPKIFSKQDLERKRYPNPSGDLYLVYQFDDEIDLIFKNQKWDISKLSKYKGGRSSGIPFVVTLTELMKVVAK
ncbi:DUF2357 domain-containing protein [Dyadobacter sp. 3J3]|uniref:DUF2357 domain-containing protein n=1 Tax=Dyadobacter sp. 3J3 TaxID=2606600 RepID=UPI001358B3FD|nr:DUF2357 domain-containing protein [Dyadobacter sp. 3J3]